MGTRGGPGNTVRSIGVAVTLFIQLAGTILLGYIIGRWLGGLLHIGPWLSIVGVLFGIVAGFVGFYHLSRVLSK